MKRDPLLPLAALVFLVLALPSAGLVSLPLVPTDPAGLLGAYGALLAVLLLAGTVRRGDGGGAGWRPLALALALTPFFLYASFAAPAQAIHAARPALALPVLVLLVGCFGAAGRRAATTAVVALTLLLGGGAVLARAGIDPWPARWNPIRQPLAAAPSVVPEDASRVGVRPGAPVRVTPEAMPLGVGPGPWWRPASRARVPLRPPIALIFDGAPDARGLERAGEVARVHASEIEVDHAMDLDGFDAVVVLERGWSPADPARARRLAAAVTGFVRRGGLLIGPPPERRWPASLARRLGAAGQSPETGPGSLRVLGMGRVVRASSGAEMRALLASDLWVRDVRTVFDRATVAPPAPDALIPAGDEAAARAPRRIAVLLLGALVLVLAAFDWVLRGAAARTLGALMASLAVTTGIAWVVPSDPGFATAGVLLELGGAGGRRVEAVRIEAGSGGYAGAVRFRGSGMVRVLGGRVDAQGRVTVAPDASAWVVREGPGLGRGPEETDDRFAGWALPFLTGRVDPKQVRYGRLPALPVRIEGAGAVPAVVVRYRSP